MGGGASKEEAEGDALGRQQQDDYHSNNNDMSSPITLPQRPRTASTPQSRGGMSSNNNNPNTNGLVNNHDDNVASTSFTSHRHNPTPSLAPPPDPSKPTDDSPGDRPRRSSFSFLRRSKSRDSNLAKRSESDGKRKLSRRNKSQSKQEAALARQRASQLPPQLPAYQDLPGPRINTPFDETDDFNPNQTSFPPSAFSRSNPSRSGYNPNAFYHRHNMDRSSSSAQDVSIPPVPASSHGSVTDRGFDPMARTESMTNRGRYSYASSAISGNVNSPRRVRRRKDPTPFNVLVVGTKSCGKTSFIEFLRTALTRPPRLRPLTPSSATQQYTRREPNSPFTSHYMETELDGERIGVTLWDYNGLEKNIIDIQLGEVSTFIESKFTETFHEEQKVLRATGVKDTHIHCVFMVLDPSRLDQNLALAAAGTRNRNASNQPRVVGGLDRDLDVELLRTLQGKTTIVPIISKADTITTAHMSYLKRTVWSSLKDLKIDPLDALNLDSDDDDDSDSAYDTASSDVRSEMATETGNAEASGKEEAQNGNGEKTVNGEGGQSGASPGKDNIVGAEDGLASSKPPQHAEIRTSNMSENVDLPILPLSVIAPDLYDPGSMGRRFPWGFADPYNAEHCDFVRLKDSVFSEWRNELRAAARERWYEGWRTVRLRNRGQHGNMNGRIPTTGGGQQRTVSGAAAYQGTLAELPVQSQTQAIPRAPKGVSSVSGPTSSNDIGVAVSSSHGGNQPPKSSYRGVGTY